MNPAEEEAPAYEEEPVYEDVDLPLEDDVETGAEETQSGSAGIPRHISVILDKIERGQELTESEEIIWKQYKKTGNNTR